MRRSTLLPKVLTTLVAIALGGCINEFDDLGQSEKPVTLEMVGGASKTDMPRGIYQVIPPQYEQVESEPPEVMHHARTLFYMNRSGGTYTPGANDSRTNRTSIPNQTAQVPAWNVSDAGWQQVMTCVRAQFADYDVEITDVDPGNVAHFESVVAGSPSDLGLDPNVGGVSPFTSDCSVINNSIVFTFAEVYGTDYQVVCEVVAQEISHSFGLDHEYLCSDPMTYLTGCGTKTFQNVEAPCGEYSERQCYCGATTQNSTAMLSARLGLKNPDTQLPTIAITYPTDGQSVRPGFTVNADASDDIGVQQVDLYIDGVLEDIKTTAPYSFATDPSLAEGTHIIETIARDGVNESSSSISVMVDAQADETDPGPGGGDPGSGTEPPGTGGTGDSPQLVGGCAAGGSAPGTSGLLLVLGMFLGLRRRRR